MHISNIECVHAIRTNGTNYNGKERTIATVVTCGTSTVHGHRLNKLSTCPYMDWSRDGMITFLNMNKLMFSRKVSESYMVLQAVHRSFSSHIMGQM